MQKFGILSQLTLYCTAVAAKASLHRLHIEADDAPLPDSREPELGRTTLLCIAQACSRRFQHSSFEAHCCRRQKLHKVT